MQWFALVVKPQHEKSVQEQLLARSVEVYVPLIKTRRRWSDRIKIAETPLFPRYAFSRFDFEDRVKVLSAPGVIRTVGFGGVPAPISEQEIDSIRSVIASGRGVRPWPLLRVGQRVRIEAGPLCGVEGVLAREKTLYRVVVNVELLNRGVAVEVERDEIRPLSAAIQPEHRPPVGRVA
jgi:transcription antitermination factor NusG